MLVSLIVYSSFMVAGIGFSRPAQQVRPQDRELIKAVRENRLAEAQRLIAEEGANINAVNNDGCSPIHFAAQNRDSVEPMKFVLRQDGVDINAYGYCDEGGIQAIHLAAICSNGPVFQELINHGAELDSKTPVHVFYTGRFSLWSTERSRTVFDIVEKEKNEEMKALFVQTIAQRKRGARTKAAR